MENKFNVGDKIRYLRHVISGDEELFTIGEIYTIEYKRNDYDVYLEGIEEDYVTEGQFELLKAIKPTKLAKKMYPNAEEKEGWLLV